MSYRDEVKQLQARRREILERLFRCRHEIAQCEQDLQQLEQQENQLLAYISSALPLEQNSRSNETSAFKNFAGPARLGESPGGLHIDPHRPNRTKGTPRPPGVPSIAEMVLQTLWDAREENSLGLKGGDIVKRINDRWWPGVSQNSIWPKLYKLYRRGRIVRLEDGLWRLE